MSSSTTRSAHSSYVSPHVSPVTGSRRTRGVLRRSGSHRSGCHIASGRTVAHRRRPAGTVHGRGSGDADRGESSTSPSARPANACQRCRRATVSIADEGSRRPAPGPASNVRRLCSTGSSRRGGLHAYAAGARANLRATRRPQV
ncbi:hypothetical protein IU11_19455 [Cellulosimicrobium sp. MM]|nr:hypothetical protein IU11_19455 [Cellulosimicrobium sp. MM]